MKAAHRNLELASTAKSGLVVIWRGVGYSWITKCDKKVWEWLRETDKISNGDKVEIVGVFLYEDDDKDAEQQKDDKSG